MSRSIRLALAGVAVACTAAPVARLIAGAPGLYSHEL
jgi:hypothetical protein